jgi:hypothetical protein
MMNSKYFEKSDRELNKCHPMYFLERPEANHHIFKLE